MRRTFILCAGDGVRWNNYLGIPKQLIEVNGETLVDRIARQARGRSTAGVFIVAREGQAIGARGCETITITRTTSLAETLLRTQSYWCEENHFILGDVFFTEHAFAKVERCDRGLVFVGRPWPSAFADCGHGELFGLILRDEAVQLARKMIARVLMEVKNGVTGNLWNLYQATAGYTYGTSPYIGRLMLVIDDASNDIDTSADYRKRHGVFVEYCEGNAEARRLSVRHTARALRHAVGIVVWAMKNAFAMRRA